MDEWNSAAPDLDDEPLDPPLGCGAHLLDAFPDRLRSPRKNLFSWLAGLFHGQGAMRRSVGST